MTEQDIQTKVEIKISQLGGFPIRLNSGKAWQGRYVAGTIVNPRAIKLCPPGTADVLAVLPEGRVMWVELKTATGRQRESQKRFQKQVEALGHTYILCRSETEYENFLKSQG